MQQRLRKGVEQRRHVGGGCLLVRARIAPHDPADLAQVQLLGEWRPRRHRAEQEEAIQVAGRLRQEVAVGGENLRAALDRPERRPGDDRVELVQPEEEGGDDSEVAAAAPDRPVEVGVLVRAGADALAAREHDLGLEQVVDRQPVLAGEMAETAAECEPADSGGRDDSARRGQPMLVRGAIDLAPGAAAADPNRARLRVDRDVAEQGQIYDDSVVNRSQPGAVVGTATDGKRQVVVTGESNGLDHFVRARAASDQRGPLVDHGVEDLARLAVFGVLRSDQRSLESAQLLACGGCRCGDTAHGVLLVRISVTSGSLAAGSRPVMTRADLLSRPLGEGE